jgi:hypothetical protein
MVRRFRSKKRMTRKMRRGGDSTSSSKKSKSRSRSSSKSKSVSSEEYVNDTCPICFEHLSANPIVTTKCKHTFHENCLIGWCSAQNFKKTCPVCRADIASTCIEITPFNSLDIFRYISDKSAMRFAANDEMCARLIADPKFDPNVTATYFSGDSETFSLFWHLAREGRWQLLDKLLVRPDLVIPAADAAAYAGDKRIKDRLIKYKKVPKALKKLWM